MKVMGSHGMVIPKHKFKTKQKKHNFTCTPSRIVEQITKQKHPNFQQKLQQRDPCN